MPAAIPLAAAAIGAAGSAYSAHKGRQAQQQQLSSAQQQAEQQRQAYEAWQQGLPIGQLAASAMGPQVTTQTGTTSFNNLTMPELTGRGQGLYDMLERAYTGRVAEADFLPEGLLEAEYGNIAQEQQVGTEAEENLMRSRGVDPALRASLLAAGPAQRQAAQARTGARLGAEQMKYQRKGTALGDVNQLLARYQTGQRQRGRTRQQSTTTGPANIGAALAAYQMGRPYEAPIIA